MDGLELLLIGGLLGLLLALIRPQTVVMPTVITPAVDDRGDGCLGVLLALLALLVLLLLGGAPL
jgi:hypothetical protein